MNILLFGATGFIGNALFHTLITDHRITIAGRKPIDGYTNWKKVDFSKNTDWPLLLEGIDLVINAIGIIEGDFDRIQTVAPSELYQHCFDKNIKIIHISAIGAEKEAPEAPFLSSKKKTDELLLNYTQSKVIYPGIVIGRKGISTQFFAEIAQFPIIPLFSDKKMSFIHINQLAELIQNIVNNFDQYPQQVFAVSKPESLQTILSVLKGKKATFIKVPSSVFKAFFTLFPKASIGIFNKDSLNMFLNSSASDYEPIFPETSKSIQPKNVIKGHTFTVLFALLAISFIWIWSGLSSLISWDQSYDLMQEIGANHEMSILFTLLGSFADLFLGIAVFWKKYRKQVIVLQMITMFVFMAILTIGAPHYWLHPFGVLSKNIPLIALSYYLYRNQYS